MPMPLPQTDPDSLALFLDLDGTIVEIAEKPDLVEIPETLLTTLSDVQKRLAGSLAVVSGRTIASLDQLLGPLNLPAAGIHGLEYRDADGRTHHRLEYEIPAEARQAVKKLTESNQDLLLEDKGSSLAIHFRQNPAKETLVRTELAALVDRMGADFTLQSGKMVVELRPAGINKGNAIEKFMTVAPFIGRNPVFIGDDLTDEDGFAVVNDMGGYSVRVGPRPPQTSAQYELPNVAAVRDWLVSLTK
jgi:trehalose 6-phosphate phosphatase